MEILDSFKQECLRTGPGCGILHLSVGLLVTREKIPWNCPFVSLLSYDQVTTKKIGSLLNSQSLTFKYSVILEKPVHCCVICRPLLTLHRATSWTLKVGIGGPLPWDLRIDNTAGFPLWTSNCHSYKRILLTGSQVATQDYQPALKKVFRTLS